MNNEHNHIHVSYNLMNTTECPLGGIIVTARVKHLLP